MLPPVVVDAAPLGNSNGGDSAPGASPFGNQRPPFGELLAVFATVVLADVAIYRGHGFAGMAALYALTPIAWMLWARRRDAHSSVWIFRGMLGLLAIRLVWHGSVFGILNGLILLPCLAASMAGASPYASVLGTLVAQTLPAGFIGLAFYGRELARRLPNVRRFAWLSVAIPLLAFLAFATLFVLANPDAVKFVGQRWTEMIQSLREWITRTALRPTEILFWVAVAWFTIGLLRPLLTFQAHRTLSKSAAPMPTAPAPLYGAARNTLITVIVLFVAYLAIEFRTLWFREFPPGFYYAGYAHEGAAWLTIALGLSTVVLSLVFTARMELDPGIAQLRRLAWIWSALNVLLAVAVYHRLFIYVGFNGMTYMRIVGLFGTTLVVVGFLLVVVKVAKQKDFVWLIRRQVWAFGLTLYLFALTPVDFLAVSYNVRSILRGNSSACMQIGVQTLDVEGTLALFPALDSSDEQIREGVKARLAQQYEQLQARRLRGEALGWTTFQLADNLAIRRLEDLRSYWKAYEEPETRKRALDRFYNYAYQWY